LAGLLQYFQTINFFQRESRLFKLDGGKNRPRFKADVANAVTVLYVINDLDIGGAQRIVAELAKQLDRSRFYPVVLNLGFAAGVETEKEIQEAGVSVIRFSHVVIEYLTIIYKIYRFLVVNRIDLVHSHLFRANLCTSLAARLAGVKNVLSTEHNTSTFTTRPWWYRRLSRLYLHYNPLNVAVSQAVATAIAELDAGAGRKTRVIYNGIDLGLFAPERYIDSGLKHSKPERFLVGALLRPDLRKGFSIFAACAGKLQSEHPAISCVIGYRKNAIETIESLQGRYGQSKRPNSFDSLNWIPLQEGPGGTARYLSQLDLFVLPSLEEGLGLAAIEAMAMGIAVVASDVGGLREVITNEQDGLLIPANDVQALARAIVLLQQDDPLRKRLAEAGRNKVRKKFAIEKMIAAYEKVYEELLWTS
jgi:glycosyltransferase involved in cell wall biosynthesis